MKRILIASAVIALGAVGLVAAEQAHAVIMPVPGGGPDRSMPTYGFWPASQPANSNKVGIFIGRRIAGQSMDLFYCSSPADATSKDPAVCKKMENFPR